jgi:phosphoribosyl 1,2-cyclic phosphodiesterase
MIALAKVNIDDRRLDNGHVFSNPHQIFFPFSYFVICNLELLPVLVPKDNFSH